jgi:hypothetical protein
VVERNQLDAELRRTDKGAVGKRKIMRIYLIGMLCGVLLATAFTYMFAVPANSDYWRMEIYKRGGGAFTMDMKTGHTGWKWMVNPIPDSPPQKPVALPASQTKSRTEKL